MFSGVRRRSWCRNEWRTPKNVCVIEGLGTRFVKVSARQHARTRSTSTSVNNINGSVSTSCPATARYSWCLTRKLNEFLKGKIEIAKTGELARTVMSVVTDFTLLISRLLASIGHLVYSWRVENYPPFSYGRLKCWIACIYRIIQHARTYS